MDSIQGCREMNPHSYLGPHKLADGSLIIRSYLPRAKRAWVEFPETGAREDMTSDGNGFYHYVSKDASGIREYKISYEDESGYIDARGDPYAYHPEISDFDLHLYGRGQLYESYLTFGSHLAVREGMSGVRFVVWAPNARSVSVVGNFNHWYAGMNPMSNVKMSGIWEIFIPDITENEYYKYAIMPKNGNNVSLRTDPYAFLTEKRPRTASIVMDIPSGWSDGQWIGNRISSGSRNSAISIYEVHLGSWRRTDSGGFKNYREIADELVNYLKQMGFTHVELMPVMEHPLDESWGYQVINYFSPTSRFGTPEDFIYFIGKMHDNGLGVILDWVPAHFPDDEYGLSMYDGTHLYDHEDPRKGKHPDWGTRIFNYGRNEVRNFLISSALFWIEKYHADGIRIDAVSSMLYLDYSRKEGEWIPNKYGGRENLEAISFLRELSYVLHDRFPGIMLIAEESTAWEGVTRPVELGGLGFDYKWNMGWMHDTLEFFSKDSIYRKYDMGRLTFSVWYAFSENFILPISHDEVVHGKGSIYRKMQGDDWQKLANARLLFSYMLTYPGKKLIFMGNEFVQDAEWNAMSSLDWHGEQETARRQVSLLLSDLNGLYRKREALHEEDCSYRGFEWIDFNDSNNSVISFIRHSKEPSGEIVAVFNFTPVARYNYVIGVNRPGFYKEIFNSDSKDYGGSGVGNYGGRLASAQGMHGKQMSLEVTLPPLGAVLFESEEVKKQ
ncbi:MAG: 1,4-alpha-glucan branching protein GlgB [Thermoplasmataceae archaeon]